ncbi:MAG: peptidylprolyl isomerase [bacterium]
MQSSQKLTGLFIALMSTIVLFTGCSPKSGDIIVAKVGPTDITLNDYEALYLKSNGTREQAAASTQEERERFLDLMTKFKLKLMDAYASGLDKRLEIKTEIAQYKGSLVASYLTEREVNAPGIKKLYDSRQVEVRASHILITLPANAPPADSAAAYEKAYKLIKELQNGARFDSLAVANSNDPSVAQNKGDLYYFTAGRMVSEFEDAAFALKAGEMILKPVRTQYGLHIIKVIDRRPASGEIKASHIMIRFDKENPSPEDTVAAFAKIKAIQDSLKTGVDFAELAMRNSQDPGSAPKGGDLGWFQRARWIQPFDEEAFKLKPGQVSGIVRTIYGYHIIKNYDTRPPKTLEESRKEIQQAYQQTRFQADYNKLMDKLKAQTQFSLDQKVVDQFVVSFDSLKTTRDSAWSQSLPPELGKKAMMHFGSRAITCDSVAALMKVRPDMLNMPLTSTALRGEIPKIAEQLIFEVKGETVEKDYPEFADIMKEYTDGILLYQVEQDRVWSKIAVNDTALQKYFEANRDKFMWPDRVELTSISLYSDSLANIIYGKLKNGKTFAGILAEDSARTKAPSNYSILFAKKKNTISTAAQKTLSTVATGLKSDGVLRLQIVAHPDTSRQKSKNEKSAQQQLDAVKSAMVKKYGIPEGRISAYSRPQASGSKKDLSQQVDLEITNQRSWFIGGIENQLQPVTTDERSMKADSLEIGVYSQPFNYRGNYTIVQLNKRDPLRRKAYEEAGTEVSSAFQEYESKRLESEWLDTLRKRYPIVENKEALKHAFAPAK